MHTKPKLTMQHFTNLQFKITPKPEANLAIEPFRYAQAGDVTNDTAVLSNVSLQVSKACKAMTVATDVNALKELCLICHHYDAKNRISWPSTLIVVRLTLLRLNYKVSFIDELLPGLSASVGLKSVSK